MNAAHGLARGKLKESSPNGSTTSRRSLLLAYLDKKVGVITNDGRMIVGVLRGFDQVCNLALENSHERVFSTNQGVQFIDHGVYVMRGDSMYVLSSCFAHVDLLVGARRYGDVSRYVWYLERY